MIDYDADNDWDDMELTKRAQAASRLAIERLKVKGCPIAICDPEKKTVYMLEPDGSKTNEIDIETWNYTHGVFQKS
ncbi:MAG: hypothetical protein IJU37_12710 [Desulfovibrio sp.]|nr:hypothetical protein [Desulfovibrio sp.]